jgi:hypothetical protein
MKLEASQNLIINVGLSNSFSKAIKDLIQLVLASLNKIVCSFQRLEEGLEHKEIMPLVPTPDNVGNYSHI